MIIIYSGIFLSSKALFLFQTTPKKSEVVLIYQMKPGQPVFAPLFVIQFLLYNNNKPALSAGLNNIKRLRTGRPDQHLRYHRLQYRCLCRSHHLRPAG
ncbi:hypothetical protein DPB93_21340 [Salmonella enterica subsp. salamae]|nr:hypothetical protein [Salmonella enterica subsp. salamae]ECI4078130.1 hypothetical protein [Salmonella enterica subsp. salamae]